MEFGQPQQLFDPEETTADVDLASVVWGSESTYPGDIVEFQDGSEWAVAVAIQQRDPDYEWEGEPEAYLPGSYPVLQFISSDGSTMSDVFSVPVIPNPPPPFLEERYCYTPKVDCTYTDFDPEPENTSLRLEVVVAYRYSCDQYSWFHIENHWDVRVTRTWFDYHYDGITDEWRWDASYAYTDQLVDSHLQSSASGQTHPDIAIDQASGDIYCAWTDLTQYSSNLYYKRYSNNAWTLARYSLKYNTNLRRHDPWYVNLDIGLVDGLPDIANGSRVVGFAYTGNFPNIPPEDLLWGFRPVLGYWSINNSPADGNHPAQVILVNPAFAPVANGAKYIAGLPVVDIPADSVDDHGAALAFVQDEEDYGAGYYEVYGISTLNYSGYTHISEPSQPYPEFAHGTLPSLAVHSTDGNMASVTFFAKEDDTEWAVWATLWTFDYVNVTADPTEVDSSALGEFEMDANDFLYHDWGTASSLVLIGNYNNYWAAWSDKMDSGEPHGVKGAMGYTDE